MEIEQTQSGPRKRGRPRRNDCPPAATGQEGRELSPTYVYTNGHGGDKETPSDADPMLALSSGIPVQGDGDYLIDKKEVMRRTSMCRGTIEYLMRYQDFPMPIKMGLRSVRWWSGEVNAWMLSRPRAKGDLGKRHSRVKPED